MRKLNPLLMMCLLLSMAASFEAPDEEADEFHFVVLGDAQFHFPATFNRIIDQTRRLRPAFVIQVGDLIEGYQNDLEVVAEEWRRFNNQVAPLAPIQYIPIPGNHDVFNSSKKVDRRLEDLFEDIWGPLYFAFDYKNASFIALNTDSSEGENQITGKQLKWLKRTLAASDKPHKFVFMHRPPLLTKNAEQLHSLFKQQGVSHVFYGHHHHYHFFERDGIAYSMTNAAANSVHQEAAVGGFHQLLQVSVRGEEVDVAVIKADAVLAQDVVHPKDNYDYFALQTNLVPSNVQLEPIGEHSYRMTIPLRNASDRAILTYLSCSSEDQRWQIDPKQIAPTQLTPKERHVVKLVASYDPKRVPESTPTCELTVPFQTVHGEWLEFAKTIKTQRPGQR